MASQTPEGQEQRSYPAEDEIDLADLVAVLVRWRWLILGGTIGLLGVALVYSLLLPAKYAVTGYLSVGKIEGEYIQEPQQVTAALNSTARVRANRLSRNNGSVGFSVQEDLSIRSEGGGILQLEIKGATKEAGAANFLGEVINGVIEDHQSQVQQVRSRLQRNISSLEAELKSLQERKAQLLNELSGPTTGEGGGRSSAALQSLVGSVDQQIEQVRLRLEEKDSVLSGLRPTKVMLEPSYSDEPVAPNTRLHAALGLVLGLFLSVFLAFLAEFWVNNRDRIMAGARH